MVSLRGDALMLLALRRRVRVDQVALSEVELQPDLVVELAPGVEMTVEAVVLPPSILGVGLGREPARALHGVTSLFGGDNPRIVGGYLSDAPAHVWNSDDRWRLRVAGGPLSRIDAGDHVDVDGTRFRFESIPLLHAGVDATRGAGGHVEPLEIVTNYDSVHVHRRGGERLVSLSGRAAMIVSELASIGGPVSWQVVAREIWRDESDDRVTLRRKWDVSLSRLRRKLRQAGIREDLIHADGLGNFELLLYEADVVHDRS